MKRAETFCSEQQYFSRQTPVAGGSASNGGCLYVSGSTVVVNDVTFTSCSAAYYVRGMCAWIYVRPCEHQHVTSIITVETLRRAVFESEYLNGFRFTTFVDL